MPPTPSVATSAMAAQMRPLRGSSPPSPRVPVHGAAVPVSWLLEPTEITALRGFDGAATGTLGSSISIEQGICATLSVAAMRSAICRARWGSAAYGDSAYASSAMLG